MIIGIAGPKRVGKDTLAQAFVAAFNAASKRDVKTYAFAGPFKKKIAEILNCTESDVDRLKTGLGAVTIRDKNLTPSSHQFDGRNFVREIGMMVRNANPNYFTNLGLDFINNNIDSHILLTDVRFNDEARMIRTCGGYILRLKFQHAYMDDHVSEQGIDDQYVDYNLTFDRGQLGQQDLYATTFIQEHNDFRPRA